MKTSRFARRSLRVRVIIACLALAATAAIEFWAGAGLAARAGQVSARQTEEPPAPRVNLSDLMAAFP